MVNRDEPRKVRFESKQAKRMRKLCLVTEKGEIVEKSCNDDRKYRVLHLENGLEALLISNQGAVFSAAALTLSVGFFNDPPEVPGVSHLLEHMLSMGNKKYPAESEFKEFVTTNGGEETAFTNDEYTGYLFSIEGQHLREALDRFAQMFISPLLRKEAVEREINAVHAEFSGKYYVDGSRIRQVYRTTANPEHPYNNWGQGCRQSLSDIPKEKKIDVYAALRTHFDHYYSANIMKLVVMGGESLDALEQWVVESFSEIPNKSVEIPLVAVAPYLPEQLPMRIDMKSLNDMREVRVEWVLGRETYANNYKALFNRLAYLFGDEGPGSIIHVLRKKGLAAALFGVQSVGNSSFSTFGVHVTCTPDGMSRIEEIIQVVLAYVWFLLQNLSKLVHVLYEVTEMQLLHFMHPPNTRLMHSLGDTTIRMHNDTPLKELLSSNYLVDFNPDVIDRLRAVLSNCTIANMIVAVIDKDSNLAATKREPWFGTSYQVKPLNHETFSGAQWTETRTEICEQMAVPAKNPFISRSVNSKTFGKLKRVKAPGGACVALRMSASAETQDIIANLSLANILKFGANDVVSLPPDKQWNGHRDVWRCPQLIEASSNAYLWLKQEVWFPKPHGTLAIAVTFADVVDSLKAHVYMRFFKFLITDLLLPLTFLASNAGYVVSLDSIHTGFRLIISGFDHKLHAVLRDVLSTIVDFDSIPKERFLRMREGLCSSWQDWTKKSPVYLCELISHSMLTGEVFELPLRSHELSELEWEDFQEFIRALFGKNSMEMFVYGNMRPAEAKELMNTAKKILCPSRSVEACADRRTFIRPEARSQVYHMRYSSDLNSASSAIYVHFILDVYSRELMAAAICLGVLLEDWFFDTIRTREQLGYTVKAGVQDMNGVICFGFKIQSDRRDPFYLDERIETFLGNVAKLLEDVSVESLSDIIKSRVLFHLQTSHSPLRAFGFWETEINARKYDFSRRTEEIRALVQLQGKDILQVYKTYLCKHAPERRKVVVGYVSAGHVNQLYSEGEVEFEPNSNRPLPREHFEKALRVDEEHGKVLFVEALESFRQEVKCFPSQDEIMGQVLNKGEEV